jgi:hypothetical protein
LALLEWVYASDGYEKIEETARAEGCVGEASKLRRLSLATHKVQMEHSPAAVLSPSFSRSPYEQAMGLRINDQGRQHSLESTVEGSGECASHHLRFVWAMIWAHFYSVQVHRTCTYHLYTLIGATYIYIYMP